MALVKDKNNYRDNRLTREDIDALRQHLFAVQQLLAQWVSLAMRISQRKKNV